jgi:lipopolysaccharide export system protein LptA
MVAVLGFAAVAVTAQNPLGELSKRSRTGKTTITSDRLEFDYKDYVALFEGHVKVVDPQFTMTANKMLVFFENTNDVRRLDAIGKVKVVSADRTATCGKATYTRANGAIVMQEQPEVSKGPNTIRGGTITVWIGDNRVEVDGAVQLEGTVGSR